MGFELRPSSTANSHFRKTKVSGDGTIGGGVRAGPFLCLLRADRKSKPGFGGIIGRAPEMENSIASLPRLPTACTQS